MKSKKMGLLMALVLLFANVTLPSNADTGSYFISAEQYYSNEKLPGARISSSEIQVNLTPTNLVMSGITSPFEATINISLNGDEQVINLAGELYCDRTINDKEVLVGTLFGYLGDTQESADMVSLDVYYSPDIGKSNFGLCVGDGSNGHIVRFYGEFDPAFQEVLEKYHHYQDCHLATEQANTLQQEDAPRANMGIALKDFQYIYGGGNVKIGTLYHYMSQEVLTNMNYFQFAEVDYDMTNINSAISNSTGIESWKITLPRPTNTKITIRNVRNGSLQPADSFPKATSSNVSANISFLIFGGGLKDITMKGPISNNFGSVNNSATWTFSSSQNLNLVVKGCFKGAGPAGSYVNHRASCTFSVKYYVTDGTSGPGYEYTINYSSPQSHAESLIKDY